MLCCVGLFGGLAVGQALGGPWTYIAPAAGFGIGLVADMKFMHRMHNKGGQQHTAMEARNEVAPVRDAAPAGQSQIDAERAPLELPQPGKG